MRRRKTHKATKVAKHCTCGTQAIGDPGRHKRRRLHDIGRAKATGCMIVRIPGKGSRKSCYIPGVGQRFVKM